LIGGSRWLAVHRTTAKATTPCTSIGKLVEARGSAREPSAEARGSAREPSVEARGSARKRSSERLLAMFSRRPWLKF
jgi:hypothetical protein